MSFPNAIWGTDGDQFAVSSDKRGMFGSVMKFVDGREFVYSRAGLVALAAGKLMQQAVVISGHDVDLPVYATTAAGATTVSIQNDGNSVFSTDQYAEGYMFVNDADGSTGEAYTYKIKSNTGVGASAVAVITLEEGSALRVGLTTSSECGFRKHPCDGLLIMAYASITGAVVGVTTRVVDASDYCWVQKKGPCAVLCTSSVLVGTEVTRSAAVDGAVDVYNQNGTADLTSVGVCLTAAGDTEYCLVELNIH